ncbi:EF-hand domain-containing protein [Polymorphobacter sp. PAMC 29334]|nr:EF-hand domain-containing protein [Polymorphobacter sp. PAMC 29334]
MTKVLSFRSAAFALMLIPIAACAQPAAQQAPAGGAASGVTLQQYVQRHERKLLLAADTDGDGRVSRDEFLAAAKAGKGDPAKRFARIDRNGDGMLDKAEIDAMLAKRFARLDSNGDGVLSPAERAAAHDKSRVAGDGAES